MYFFLIIIFLIYLFIFLKIKNNPSQTNNTYNLKISIVIAAKNEAQNLPKLISSLEKLNYSKDNYEVIIVDDKSTDSTFDITEKRIIAYPNFKVIKASEKLFLGKRGALQIGIDSAKYDYILITDADCVVDNNLLNSYSNKFQENYDFVFGGSPYYQTNTIANKIACFDNLWVHILTFSFANIGLPYSAAARNFGFKKKSFEKIKGYQNTTDTLSGDDDLLLREAVKNNLKISVINDFDSFVYSNAKENVKDFINQKSRHTSTSNYYSIKVKLFLGFWHFLNLAMLFGIFFYPISDKFLLLFSLKLFGDIIIIKSLMKMFSYNFKLLEIIWLQILYECFLVVNYLKSFSKRVEW